MKIREIIFQRPFTFPFFLQVEGKFESLFPQTLFDQKFKNDIEIQRRLKGSPNAFPENVCFIQCFILQGWQPIAHANGVR